MASQKSPKDKSLRAQLRTRATELNEREMKILGINRKDYRRLKDDASGVARQLSKDYLQSAEQDGTRISAHHDRRLASLRATPRRRGWQLNFGDGFPGDPFEPEPPRDFGNEAGEFPPEGFPPEGRPFDEKPEFPEIVCFYTPITTLDTVARHVHTNIVDGVSSDASFTDDLTEGRNQCQPFAELVSLLEEGDKEVGFRSAFRFNFMPATSDTFRFHPAAFVNGFAFTFEQGGINNGMFLGPRWSINLRMTLRVSQFSSGFYRLITREVFSAEQGDSTSNEIFYDSTSDARATLSAFLEANSRAHVVVAFEADLRSRNSFPSVRFDGAEQYFKVPEVYVDRLECHREGAFVIRG